jgi:hypothetical protein
MEVNVLKEDVSVQAHLKELAVRKVYFLLFLFVSQVMLCTFLMICIYIQTFRNVLSVTYLDVRLLA